MAEKMSANQRRLAKLIREWDESNTLQIGWDGFAAFLSKRGVLAVSAQTVPSDEFWPDPTVEVCRHLRRLARGT
jgi:hypothetical protein